jgi:superfamily II DNA helicase RecQ
LLTVHMDNDDSIVDLTDDLDLIPCVATRNSAGVDNESVLRGDDDDGDYNVDEILRGDAQLRNLRRQAAAARILLAQCERAYADAQDDTRRLERLITIRTKELVDAAENNIDWLGRKFPWDEQLAVALRETFHISSFRPLQREAINAFLANRDVTAILPTGSGKSLIYQLAAVVDGGITVVVTPLVSLMQDQVDGLRRLGVIAYSLDASTSKHESTAIFSEALPVSTKKKPKKPAETFSAALPTSSWTQKSNSAILIYVTPERVSKSKKFMARLAIAYESMNLSRFVIDEAHCISSMGHDFRQDYTLLNVFRRHFPKVPIAALTATATEQIATEIATSLKLRPVVFRSSIDRPNLFYEVRVKTSDAISDIAELIQTDFRGKCGIVYCLSRKDTEDVATHLSSRGVLSHFYHGDMDAAHRRTVYNDWSIGRVQCVVATISFGLGINKPDVRFVIHHTVASSLSGYYQESGRAGRDGAPSKCIMYWSPTEMVRLSNFVADKGLSRLPMLYDACRYAMGRSSAQARRIGGSNDDSGGGGDSVEDVESAVNKTGKGLKPAKRPRTSAFPSVACRRSIIASAFGEMPPPRIDPATSKSEMKILMQQGYGLATECCDLCAGAASLSGVVPLDVTSYAASAVRIVRHYRRTQIDGKLTLNTLATLWSNTGAAGKKMRGVEPAAPRQLDKATRLDILLSCVLEGVLSEFHVYGAYSMQGYVAEGDASVACERGLVRVAIDVPTDSELLLFNGTDE